MPINKCNIQFVAYFRYWKKKIKYENVLFNYNKGKAIYIYFLTKILCSV